MSHELRLFFDDDADAEIRRRWRLLDDAGVPSVATRTHGRHRPHVTLAAGKAIPASARKSLRAELGLLSIPDLWLSTLGTFANTESVLFLGAVVDTEVLAVHSAVHDILAGKVAQPSAYSFPGAWVPHCTLAQGITPEQLSNGFALLQPPEPVRARTREVGIVDTRTGETDLLLS